MAAAPSGVFNLQNQGTNSGGEYVYAGVGNVIGVNSVVTLNASSANAAQWQVSGNTILFVGPAGSANPLCLDAFFPGSGNGGSTTTIVGSFVFLNTPNGSVTQMWSWQQNSGSGLWAISNIGLSSAYAGYRGPLFLNNDNGGTGPNQHLQLFSYGSNQPGDNNSWWGTIAV